MTSAKPHHARDPSRAVARHPVRRSADVYFARAEEILAKEGLDPVVVMEVFARRDAVLCGIDEAKVLLADVLTRRATPGETDVEALADGDLISPKEVVLRIRAPVSRLRPVRDGDPGHHGPVDRLGDGRARMRRRGRAGAGHQLRRAPRPPGGHRHARLRGDHRRLRRRVDARRRAPGRPRPTGTMPHSLVLIFGDTVRAAEAFDRHMPPDVPRIVLVDTFRDEAEEALRVAEALGDRLYGIRLDTPVERGRVTPELVREVRARLDQAGYATSRSSSAAASTPERIGFFKEAGAPVDSYAVGSYISRRAAHRLHRRPQGDRRPGRSPSAAASRA